MIDDIKKEYERRMKAVDEKIKAMESNVDKHADEIKYKETEINDKIDMRKRLLDSLEKQVISFSEKIKFYVETKWNGFHATIHKEGDKVKIFSEQLRDITKHFPTLIDSVKRLDPGKFVIDGELVPYEGEKALGRNELIKIISKGAHDDSNIKLHVWDIVFYDNYGNNGDLTDLPLYERKTYLDKLKFNNRVTNTKYYIVSNAQELKSAMEKVAEPNYSEGAVVKDASSKYKRGTNNRWWKYRKVRELNVINIKKITNAGNTYNYEFGIIIQTKDLRVLDPNYIIDTPRGKVLKIGKTFNTKLNIGEYDTFSITVEEIWRHEKKSGIHYSAHKPAVKDTYHPNESKSTSSVNDLEDIVTSIGVAVKQDNMSMQIEFATDEEGARGREIMNWPGWIQGPLKIIRDKKMWMPFVIQHHYRGHHVTAEDNLPEKYKYDLRSVHTDFRAFMPNNIDKLPEGTDIKYNDAKNKDGICFGITIDSPASVDRTDEVKDGGKNILCEFKPPVPKSWLYAEALFPEGGIGATAKSPAMMVIVAKGEYTVHTVEDHKITLEFRTDSGDVNSSIFSKADKAGIHISEKFSNKLKQINNLVNFTINHIGEKHIILLNIIAKQSSMKDILNKIAVMTALEYSRPRIAQELSISKGTVYRHQKTLGLI